MPISSHNPERKQDDVERCARVMPEKALRASSSRWKWYPVLLCRHPANFPQVTPVINRRHIPNIVATFSWHTTHSSLYFSNEKASTYQRKALPENLFCDTVGNTRIEMFTVDDHLIGTVILDEPSSPPGVAHDCETPYFCTISFTLKSFGINTFSLRISWSAVSMHGSSV